MASTNQSPQFQKAQGMFLNAKTNEEKAKWLEEMIREAPKHKSSEKMNANLKTRLIKLNEKIEAQKKASKGSRKIGIKKEEMQAVIVGLTGSGKSSLISVLTNTKPEIAPYDFTTKFPVVGMMPFSGTQIQIIEIPAIESEYFDRGLANSAEVMLVLINKIEDTTKIDGLLSTVNKKRIIIFNNKYDLEERKIESTLRSKKLNYVMINTETLEGIQELKEKLFQAFGKIRVFTKEPGKEKSVKPFVLEKKSCIKDVAKKVLKNLSVLKETRIWGPSSKFPGQVVGLNHELKDLDVVEFKTR